MNEKIEKYFNLLHPEYESLTPEEQAKLEGDRNFIEDHLYEIDEMYISLYESGRNQSNMMMPLIMSLLRTRNYLDILHPEYKNLNKKEQLSSKYVYDEEIISDNIDEINEKYHSLYESGKNPEEIMRIIMSYFRTKYYFNKLHPEYESVSKEEQWRSQYVTDEKIISDNIDEINEKYHSLYESGKNPEEIMPLIMSQFRERNSEKERQPETTQKEDIIPIDEFKYAQVYEKAKGRIKEVFSKIKQFFNGKDKRDEKTDDETTKEGEI